MNHWARFLHEAPAMHQRLIARAQRISQPRRVTADERAERLRRSLCHAATVRAVFALLDDAERAAVADLRTRRRGIAAAELAARYGSIRPLRQIAADLRPQSVAERLFLRGWLFPRPSARGQPTRWLLPPELRRWLPTPLALPDNGPAPTPTRPPALRAAAVILHTCALGPLPVRADHRPRQAAMRRLVAQLAPLPPAEAAALLEWALPVLEQLNLVALHNQVCSPTPAARRFLALAESDQLARLVGGWLGLPGPDAWLARRLRSQAGIYWGLLHRRLWAWAAALPAGRLLGPETITPALAATLGPLADAQTHGFRTVDRAPWRARRSATIFEAALRGPLAWLGAVAWDAASGQVFRPAAWPTPTPAPWRYGPGGQLIVPHGSAEHAVPDLLLFARWHAADADTTTYDINAATLARAIGHGHSAAALRALLMQQAGPLPPDWATLLADHTPALRLLHADVLIADEPAALTRAARSATVQRALAARLAPGIALVRGTHTRRLARALARRGLPLEQAPPDVPAAPPAELTPGQCATLLAACAAYRQSEQCHDSPGVLDQVEERLRAGLTPALREDDPPPPAEPALFAPAHSPPTPPIAERLADIRRAIKARRPLELAYDTGGYGAAAWRTIQPCMLESHGDVWLLRAYCNSRRADRVFRVDRIAAIRRL